jgi:glutamate-1-semialdehyde 2,1-aminomutase
MAAFGATPEFFDLIYPPGPMIHFGTYNANPLSVAASLACLTRVMTDEVYARIRNLGERFKKGMADSIERHGIRAVVSGTGGMYTVFFQERIPHNYRETLGMDKAAWNAWWMYLVTKGVYFSAPSPYEETFISAAMTEKDVDEALGIVDDAFKQL